MVWIFQEGKTITVDAAYGKHIRSLRTHHRHQRDPSMTTRTTCKTKKMTTSSRYKEDKSRKHVPPRPEIHLTKPTGSWIWLRTQLRTTSQIIMRRIEDPNKHTHKGQQRERHIQATIWPSSILRRRTEDEWMTSERRKREMIVQMKMKKIRPVLRRTRRQMESGEGAPPRTWRSMH